MSPQVKRVGAVTILMWMVGLFIIPVIGYIASNALQMPTVVEQLKHITDTQGQIVAEMRLDRLDRVEEARVNVEEHREIIEVLTRTQYELETVVKDCKDNEKEIDLCKSSYWERLNHAE